MTSAWGDLTGIAAVPELLTIAAFVLGVIAIIIAFTWHWWALAPGLRSQGAAQPDAVMNVPREFAAAEAASKEARRATVARQERVRKVLVPVAFGLAGSTVIIALAAFFWAGDREATTVCAMIACIALGSTTASYSSARRARQKAIHLGNSI